MIHSRQQFFAPEKPAFPPFFTAQNSSLPTLRIKPASDRKSPPRLPVLDEARGDYSLEEAYAYCQKLSQVRGAGLPVATKLLPEPMRRHVLAVYAFLRAADDFADEPAYEGKRHFALDAWESELFRTFHGEADHPIFVALRHTVETRELPISPFSDLLTGFRLDLRPAPFITWNELRTYTRHRSESLGQIILLLFGYRDPSLLRYAAELCTALQLTTFLQDLGPDLDRGRIYLPLEDLHHFGINDATLASLSHGRRHDKKAPRAFRDLLAFESARARALFLRGRPLLNAVGEDLQPELRLTYHSALAMLDKLDDLGESVLAMPGRPLLGRGDRAKVLAKAIGLRLSAWPQWIARGGDFMDF